MSKNIKAAIAALEAEKVEKMKEIEPLDKMIAHLKKQLAPKVEDKKEEGK